MGANISVYAIQKFNNTQLEKMRKETRNGITKLSAITTVNIIYLKGYFKEIEEANMALLKHQYKYDTLSPANKKFIDKKIADSMKNLKITVQTVIKVLERIEKSMRNELSDDIVEDLIDLIDSALDKIDLEELMRKKIAAQL